jgi:hypothetical protein
MYCPNCAAPLPDQRVAFCSRCGHDIGERPAMRTAFRDSFILAAIGLMLMPVWIFIGAAFPAADRLVESHPSTTWPEQIAWIAMWMAFIAAALRLLFAVAFRRRQPGLERLDDPQSELGGEQCRGGLPSADSFNAAAAGLWRTTDELAAPVSSRQRTSGGL